MIKKYTAISAYPSPPNLTVSHAVDLPLYVKWEDPALQVLIDFHHIQPIFIAPHATLNEAGLEMRLCHTPLLIVLNNNEEVMGLISSEDILGEKPLKVIQEKQIPRTEILVRMVMTHKSHLIAIDYGDLLTAKVGNIVETLREAKEYYALAIEYEPGRENPVVRGLFSLPKIASLLGNRLISDLTEPTSIMDLQRQVGR